MPAAPHQTRTPINVIAHQHAAPGRQPVEYPSEWPNTPALSRWHGDASAEGGDGACRIAGSLANDSCRIQDLGRSSGKFSRG